MANGRVQRIDDDRRVAYIVRDGRTYRADLGEVEGRARVPSARVRFDLVRRGGEETAANVRLRPGTRTGRRQRRFGDLTGARSPGAKTATSSDALGVDVTTQPMRVVAAWVDAMARSDHDGAAGLARPDIVFVGPDGPGRGRRHFRALLERCSFDGVAPASLAATARDRLVELDPGSTSALADPGSDADDGAGKPTSSPADHRAAFVIDHGAIAEAWVDVGPPTAPEGDETDDDEPTIATMRRGDVGDDDLLDAESRLRAIIARTVPNAVGGRVKVTSSRHVGLERPNLAELVVDAAGWSVRARAEGSTAAEAIDRAAERLRSQLEHRHDRHRHRPDGLEPGPGQWRHGNVRRPSRIGYDRPLGDREIVRHKSFAPDFMTVDEAAWDMALLDYDFFLFVDEATGLDSLLERGDDDVLLLRRTRNPPGCEPAESGPVGIDLVPVDTPSLAVSTAVELLDGADRDLLFFTNDATDRANVLYRRLDGHYGLITPPTAEADDGMTPSDRGPNDDPGSG